MPNRLLVRFENRKGDSFFDFKTKAFNANKGLEKTGETYLLDGLKIITERYPDVPFRIRYVRSYKEGLMFQMKIIEYCRKDNLNSETIRMICNEIFHPNLENIDYFLILNQKYKSVITTGYISHVLEPLGIKRKIRCDAFKVIWIYYSSENRY